MELKDGKWQASIDLQWLAELVDKALNHVDTRKTKMTALAYKYFPVSSHIWVNSIATPRYKKFKEYIDEVLKTDKQIIDRPFNDNGYKNFVKKAPVSSVYLHYPSISQIVHGTYLPRFLI